MQAAKRSLGKTETHFFSNSTCSYAHGLLPYGFKTDCSAEPPTSAAGCRKMQKQYCVSTHYEKNSSFSVCATRPAKEFTRERDNQPIRKQEVR